MTRALAALLILGTIPWDGLPEDSERVMALRARLEHVIRQTGPTDPRPTVLIQHVTYTDTSHGCWISDLEGKRVWKGIGDSPRAAAREAFADYWRDFK